MREIKFRAWDTDKNKMVKVDTIDFYNGNVNDVDFYNQEMHFGFSTILLQYTGLKDKNGTEIYEGDVLQAFDREDFRMQIVYREPSFCIKWFDETIKSVRQTRDGTEPIPHNIHVTSRVIGNIYEHPHLLKEELQNEK